MKLEEQIEFCHKCDKETLWKARDDGRLQCVGCRDIFPCKMCGHLDCVDARGDREDYLVGDFDELEEVTDTNSRCLGSYGKLPIADDHDNNGIYPCPICNLPLNAYTLNQKTVTIPRHK